MIRLGWRTRPGKYGEKDAGAHDGQDEITNLSVEFGDGIELEAHMAQDSRPGPPARRPMVYMRVGNMEIRISAGRIEVSNAASVTTAAPVVFHGGAKP
jgi:hypothetical protein